MSSDTPVVDPSDEHVDDFAADEDEATNEQSEALDLSGGERRLVTQPYDLGVKGIADDIAAGNIALDIQYQRKYVWDRSKASRLIESLLLNIPIPVCYFAEDEEGVYEVIDGLQRLTTIRDFLNDDFSLSGLPVLQELEGKKFSELAPRDRRRLENKTIRCIVITEDSHPDIKFDVFERLNTGAAMLTAQELRNSVYRGPLNDSLRALAQEPYFTGLVGPATNRRMDLEEMVLRFLALVSDLSEYKPPLRQFLNSYMRENRQKPASNELVAIFEDSCVTAKEVLGVSPFRVPGSKNLLNKAVFDAVMVPIALADRTALRANGGEVPAVVETLLADEQFQTAIGRATADRQRMLYRIGAFAQGLRELGVPVNLPERFGLPEVEAGTD